MQTIITNILRSLGITRNYRGYRQLFHALVLVLEDEDRLLQVTKEIYIPVSKKFHCDPRTVERNIRTIIHRLWHTNRDLYTKMAGYESTVPPTVSELIDTLAVAVKEQILASIIIT